MQRFVVEENIHRFEIRLRTETDPHMRGVLEGLLQDERAKLSVLFGITPPAAEDGLNPGAPDDSLRPI